MWPFRPFPFTLPFFKAQESQSVVVPLLEPCTLLPGGWCPLFLPLTKCALLMCLLCALLPCPLYPHHTGALGCRLHAPCASCAL